MTKRISIMKKTSLVIFLFFTLCSGASLAKQAKPVSAVHVNECNQLLHQGNQPFILVLKKGEKIINSLMHCAKEAHISAASFSGLGALENPTLAYYNIKNKKYQDKTFSGSYELASINGTLTMFEKKPYIHAHVVLGDAKYSAKSGHLKESKVGATAEITIIPLKNNIMRKIDATTGLNVIR